MAQSPLGEVFGFPTDHRSDAARTIQDNRRCPFKAGGALCNKSSKTDPIGVCSVLDAGQPVITCPVRLTQDWLIAQDAARFFFSPGTSWTRVPEVALKVLTADNRRITAGNIDLVLAAHDDTGQVLDFGALEIQSVYISGTVKPVFKAFMANRDSGHAFSWTNRKMWPEPDWLSSSRKRLMPQLLYKGAILKSWGKKQAVAIQQSFYDTLPPLDTSQTEVAKTAADMAWLIYDLDLDIVSNRYTLVKKRTIYTAFEPTLELLTKPRISGTEPSPEFMTSIRSKLQKVLAGVQLDLNPNADPGDKP